MPNANFIDISEWQNPSTFDYAAVKAAGIQTVIIRLSVSLRTDYHAAEHIANCEKYGLKWHGYHYWYNQSGEASFAVQNAQALGLKSDRYFFLDMEDKSLSSDWSNQFESFRQTIGSAFKPGLYCSDSPYKEHFNNDTLANEGVCRWIASYDYEPANYDAWQISGAGSGGFGSYTGDVDRDYDKTGNLITTSASDNVPTIPAGEAYRQIALEPGYDTDTGVYGKGYSPDNGQHFYVTDTTYGRRFRQEDADRLWPYLKSKIGSATTGGGITVIDDSGDPQPSQAPTKTVTVFDDSKIKAGSISPSGGMSSSETDKEAQAMGMNAVTVSVLVTFDTATSANPTIKDADLQLAEQNIKDLTAKGYKVIVQPYPWIAGGTVVETQLKPADDEIAWFGMYYLNALNTIAELAEKYKCYGMYVATNLTQLEKYTSMWSGFIKKVKETFTGKIFFRTNWWYDATWDNDTTAAHQKVVNYDFWADVDVIAIAAYFEVTDTVAPTSAQLQASIRKVDKYNRGQNIEQEIKDFHEKWNKPIFFGELGIPPYKTAPSTPWDDKASDYKDATLDYQVQANWFDAWYNVFKDYNWWLGYSIFTIDDSNSLYNPYGHPAADVIKQHFYTTKTVSVATEDFDNAKQTIAYQVTATNVANQPVAKPGLLIAKQYGAYVTQTYITETGDVYFRAYTPAKTWTKWAQNTFFN